MSQGTPRDKTNSQFLAGGQHLRLGIPGPNRILALQRGDRLDGVGAANRSRPGFREAEVFHLAGPNQILDRASDVFDWDVRIDAMLIKNIDDIGTEAFERG